MFLTWFTWGFLHPHMLFPSTFSSHKVFRQSQFSRSHKIMEDGRNYNKIPLSNGQEKHHVDTYMVTNTTRNKTRDKYFKEVS